MKTSSFFEDLKSYAQQAVLVRRAATASPEDHALADALNQHISLFQSSGALDCPPPPPPHTTHDNPFHL